jgi:protein-disulfide isomerase
MKRQHIALLGGATLLALFLIAGFVYKSLQAERLGAISRTTYSPLEREHSPGKGPADARVVLVEYFDPACETCRVFSAHVDDILRSHPEEVRLVLRYAPLHEGSDTMVKILEAAKLQGRFFETLQLMYDTQPLWASHHHPQPEKIWEFLPQAGVDVDRIRSDMMSAEIRGILAQDIADGASLGVRKTPQFFVNGRPLARFGLQQLQTLVQSEVAAQY